MADRKIVSMPTARKSVSKVVAEPEVEEHQHNWSNGATLTRSRVSRSPCSTWDDHLWDDIIQVQTCGCGAIRKLLLGFKNRRRRGDDLRKQSGLGPLGTPLTRSGIYEPPRVLKS